MIYHVLPINDIHPHSEDSTCECCPSIMFVEGNMIIVHNSFDGREAFEFESKEEPESDFSDERGYNLPEEE